MQKTFFYILSAIFIFSSCISEDRDNCVDEDCDCVKVYLSYVPMCYQYAYEDEGINRIDLFAFDSEGKYIDRWTDFPDNLTSDYYMNISLDAGNYKFVAWGNLRDCYYVTPDKLIPGQTTIDDIMVHLHRNDNDTIHTEPHVLYFSDIDNEKITNLGGKDIRMSLSHNVHRIHLSIYGLDVEAESLNIVVADTHSSFNFDNTAAYSASRFHYVGSCITDEEKALRSVITTMKLNMDRETIIKLYNHYNDEIIYETELTHLIDLLEIQGMHIDFDTECIVDIGLSFDANMNVSVVINGWKVIEESGEI